MNNLDPFTIIVGGIIITVVTLIIVRKFGRIIASLLTILGGLSLLFLAYLVYTALNANINLEALQTLLGLLK